jgi:hypothetical protein
MIAAAAVVLHWPWGPTPGTEAQQSANMLCNRSMLLKLKPKKISLILFVRLSRSLRFGKFACLMITGCDGCTADAEHQRQRQQLWHIYFMYVVPQAQCAWFAIMSAMFRASVAGVWWLIIISNNLGVVWAGTFESQALPHLFLPGFLNWIWVRLREIMCNYKSLLTRKVLFDMSYVSQSWEMRKKQSFSLEYILQMHSR